MGLADLQMGDLDSDSGQRRTFTPRSDLDPCCLQMELLGRSSLKVTRQMMHHTSLECPVIRMVNDPSPSRATSPITPATRREGHQPPCGVTPQDQAGKFSNRGALQPRQMLGVREATC